MSSEILDNGVFCVMPWTHFAVTPEGRVRPCSWEAVTHLKVDETSYNVLDHDISNHSVQPPINELKKNMLSGKKSEYCSRCYEQESLCGISKRTVETFGFQKEAAERIVTGEEAQIAQLELRLGNMCNIGCMTCHPRSSNFFVREIDKNDADIKIFEKKFQKQYKDVYKKSFDWYQKDEFWQKIENLLPSLEYVYIAGGEPTIIKENWSFLERLVELGYSKNIKLGISTNLTNVQPKHVEIYNKFKETNIYSSIDAYGNLNDYVRYPSKWSAISSNFEKLCRLADKDVVKFNVIPVVSILTVWKLDDLCDWVFEIKRQTNANIDFNTHTLLKDPEYMSIFNLPDDAKQKALKVVENMQKHFDKDSMQIQRIRDYLRNSVGNGNNEIFFQGRKYIENFDSIRNNSWKDYVPELTEWWK